MIEILPWDSEFFGFTVARVHEEPSPEIVAELRSQGVRCAYYSGKPTRDMASLGFELADSRVDFMCPLVNEHATFHKASPGIAELLVQLSREAFSDSRFYADPRFDRAKVDELFAVWVRNSFSGLADAVLIPEKELKGFVTVKISGTSARIGLIAVGDEYRGQGIGRALLSQAKAFAQKGGAKSLFVATQGTNDAARRLYESAGFRVAQESKTFHWWA